MLDWLKSLLKSLWSLLKKIWPILLVAGLALFFLNPVLFSAITSWVGGAFTTMLSGLGTAFSWWTGLFEGLTFWEGAALAVGTAFLIDPEWAGKTVSEIGSTVGSTVGAVASSVTGGVLGAITDSGVLPWAIGGLVLWLLLRKGNGNNEPPVEIYNSQPQLQLSSSEVK